MAEIETISPPAPPLETRSREYQAQDFRILYEQEYAVHQETKLKLQRANDKIDYLEDKVEKLEADIAYLKKLLFSPKREQAVHFPQDLEDPVGVGSKNHGAQPGHEGHGRKIPTNLLMQDHRHFIASEDCYCPACGMPFKELKAEEISYEVTVEVRYVLFRHRRKKYKTTCRCMQPIVTSPGPVKLFEKGLYSIDFWIKVLVDKYAYGLPLTRQVGMMEAEGLEISCGVLCDGLLRAAPYLKPLYELMKHQIAFEKLVHGDETRWWNWASSYDTELEDENTRQWLWGFFSKHYHVFVIDASRSTAVILNTLGQGEAKTVVPILVADRYKAYQKASHTVAFCWAHVRRDFLKLQIQYPQDQELVGWCDTWLALIGDLYGLNDLRLKHRGNTELFEAYQKQIQEVLERMQGLMNAPYTKKPQIAQVESMRNHWKGLTLFLEDPEIPLDNNLAERALRTPVVGRKNFYGVHSDRAAEATAIFYSILSTLKLHNIRPRKFLNRFLTLCAQSRGRPIPPQTLEFFLPHRYAQQYPEDLAPA